jgi:hypothetical protein
MLAHLRGRTSSNTTNRIFWRITGNSVIAWLSILIRLFPLQDPFILGPLSTHPIRSLSANRRDPSNGTTWEQDLPGNQ